MSCLGISSLDLSFTPSCFGGLPGPHWRNVEAHVLSEDGTLQRETFYRSRRDRISGELVGPFLDKHRFPVDPREYHGQEVERHEEDDVLYESVVGNRVMHLREHIPSGDLYDRGRTGPPSMIAGKSFCILYGSVPYALGMMAMNLIAAAVHTLIVLKDAFFALGGEGITAACGTLARGLYERVGSDLFIVVMSPLYMLGLQAGAFIGLFSQDDGMRIMDKVERAWHRGATYRDALQYNGRRARRVGECCEDLEILTVLQQPYIMAWCLLRRGNRRDLIHGPNEGEIDRFDFIQV